MTKQIVKEIAEEVKKHRILGKIPVCGVKSYKK
jgi:hypothetical protein